MPPAFVSNDKGGLAAMARTENKDITFRSKLEQLTDHQFEWLISQLQEEGFVPSPQAQVYDHASPPEHCETST